MSDEKEGSNVESGSGAEAEKLPEASAVPDGTGAGSSETASADSAGSSSQSSSTASAGSSTQTSSTAGSSAASESKPVDASQAVFKRRPLLRACLDSFNYVNSISQDEAVKVRDSDRATSIWLMIVSILTVGAMLIEPLAPHRMPLLVVCDILIGTSIFYYIANRFGIIGTFNPRQALLSWQLMMGATFFGIFLTINLALLLGIVVVLTAPTEIPSL